ncbi:hypothetical protein IFR35_03875 [Pseudomonas fluorescens]|jgi:hypothetical protein|uniref:Uncharacterized protein n=3 Tax=Pseudomonas fluorescens group TaxID=136843 RepID=A0A3M4AHQ7_PSEMA|nr:MULTISPECIES: hypothetical protein [Pseudomonas]MBD8190567.1 hypothetical protein [Pseudomonas fluorescens]MBD8225193.1 hypothetical protein [Pseudomonas fluorescens]MBD8783349.1 hypothetical protein [Pseudomonas fluorescens]MBD8815738.1 hypothetical protein [Pseudomonas fluorescens]MCD7040955.1 hypothetical protein [Pseudomonas petroselini]
MLDTIDVNFHGKRHTDFDLKRIIKAQEQGFDVPVTAYLCGVSIRSRAGIGVVFGHKRKDQYGRFGDGHLIRTSDVLKVEREGRFWVMTTVNSRYVLATFQRDNGRASLRQYLRLSSAQHHLSPNLLQ